MTEASVEVNVDEAFELELMSNGTACDTGGGANVTTVDLDDMIIAANGNGTWTTTDNAPIDPATNEVDFEGLPLGAYTFTYTLFDVASVCPAVPGSVTVTVVDCSCPVLTLDRIADQCNDAGTINLNALLVNDNSGSWTIDPPTLTEIGGIINVGGGAAGDYNVTFTHDAILGGTCVDEVSQSFTLSEAPVASATLDLLEVCNGTTLDVGLDTMLNLNEFIVGDVGEWSVTSDFNGGVIADPTAISFIGIPAATYTFTFTTTCLLYTSPSPRDRQKSRMPSSA